MLENCIYTLRVCSDEEVNPEFVEVNWSHNCAWIKWRAFKECMFANTGITASGSRKKTEYEFAEKEKTQTTESGN